MRHQRFEMWAIVAMIVLLSALVYVLAPAAHGQHTTGRQREAPPQAGQEPAEAVASVRDSHRPPPPGPPSVVGGSPLQLARMAQLECSIVAHPHCANDMAAMWYVGLRQPDPIAHLQRYTKLYQRSNARARRIAAFPWGDVPGWPKRWNRSWRAYRAHAQAVVAGLVTDPCPGAEHWGGPGVDEVPASMVPVRCSRPTRNLFLRMR